MHVTTRFGKKLLRKTFCIIPQPKNICISDFFHLVNYFPNILFFSLDAPTSDVSTSNELANNASNELAADTSSSNEAKSLSQSSTQRLTP